jgi:oligoribonuclease NrnB/cAMP/cGMP phosphodiesterase (DHH superfamily)
MTPLCIYHGNCADGFTAAWAVHRKFGAQLDYHPGVYGQEPPDVTGRDVVMVDFSYKRPVLDAMEQTAQSLLILDHHKTAQADLADVQEAPTASQWLDHEWNTLLSVGSIHMAAVFDMERSGAQIAWDYFHPRTARPLLVDYVGDRDLWRFKLPLSREVNAFVFAHEYTFQNWDYLDAQLRDHMDVQRVAGMGGAIEKKHHKDVAELVNVTRRTMRIGGRDMPVANIPYTLTSDAGHLMARCDQGVAACYWDTPDGRTFSLRSTDDGPDVSEIAKSYGGGGHKNAAGFRMPRGWEGDQNDQHKD